MEYHEINWNTPKTEEEKRNTPKTEEEKLQAQIEEVEERYRKHQKMLDELQAERLSITKSKAELYEEYQKKLNRIQTKEESVLDKLVTEGSKAEEVFAELERSRQFYKEFLDNKELRDRNLQLAEEIKAMLAEHDVLAEHIMDFQKEGVANILSAYRGGNKGLVLADDMGLGKTFQFIAFTAIQWPCRVLYLTKQSLVRTTIDEFNTWAPEIPVVEFTAKLFKDKATRDMAWEVYTSHDPHPVVVTNYEMLNNFPAMKSHEFDIVAADEVHKLKGGANPKPTQVWNNVRDVVRAARFYVPMSGSPVQNHPRELWAYLHMLDPELFPTANEFERHYGYDWEWNPEQALKRLLNLLEGRILRRSKKDVAMQLPEKVYQTRYVELSDSERDLYDQIKRHLIAKIESEQGDKQVSIEGVLAQLTRLRQVAQCAAGMHMEDAGLKLSLDGTVYRESIDIEWDFPSAKIDEAVELIMQLHLEGEQVVVFSSQFNAPLTVLAKRLDEIGITHETISGKTQDVLAVQSRFQQAETNVLLVNAKSGAEGLNLQKSDRWPGGSNNAIFLDQWWNPEANRQAEDRLYRKGQTDTVHIYKIEAENTIDQYIKDILKRKTNMIEYLMESDAVRSTDWKDLI